MFLWLNTYTFTLVGGTGSKNQHIHGIWIY